MMKKAVSLLLALVMALSLCSSAWATGIGQADDKEDNQQESGPVWPEGATHLEFCENGEYYNGKGIDPGASVTFNALYAEANHNTAIEGFTVSDETSAGLNAEVTTDGKLTVTVNENCEPGDKFVVLMVGTTKYALRLNVNEVGGNQGGGPNWPTMEKFCFKDKDNDGEIGFFNGTGIDQGETVTFKEIFFKDKDSYTKIGSFAVDGDMTSEGLTATANGEALTVTVADDCELGERFVVIVADNTKYSMCFHVREAGGSQGGNDRPSTGNVIDTKQLSDAAQGFIGEHGKYVGYYYNSEHNVVRLGIKDENGEDVTVNNKEWYTNAAARAAVIAAYNAFCNIGLDVQNELNTLFVMDDNSNPCTFDSYMLGMRQLADNGSGTYKDTNALNVRLRNAGYIAPVLGRDLLLSFPGELVRGEDYDYTYDQTSGHLTITVKKGSAERWLNAAEGSFSDDRVLFNMTLVNTEDKALWQFWNGNNDGGTWEQFVDGTMKLEQKKSSEFENGDTLAVVNRENDTLSMTSSADNRNYRVLMIWANEGEEFPNMTKYMYTYEVKVEESFCYERQNVPTIGKVDISRVKWNVLPERWTCDNSESGVLKIWYEGALDGETVGKVTVDAPVGYTLRVDECRVLDGDKEQLDGNTNDAGQCDLQLRGPGRDTFLLTWKDKEGKKKQETLDVFFLQNILDTLGNYDIGSDGELIERETPLNVTKPESVESPTNGQTTVRYNSGEGFFYTSFDYGVLPTYDQLQEGVLLKPDGMNGATHFRVNEQSTGDMPRQEATTAQSLVMGFAGMSEKETYEIKDTANDRLRTLPYVDTDYQEIGGIQVSYAADQGYRYKIVQWLRKDGNGIYTVLGYSYVWGRNDAFINRIQTPSVAAGSEAAGKGPFVIGEDMQLRCDRYPQYGGDGKIQYFQFRAYGGHEGSYTVYIPYEYFGMSQAEGLALRDRGQRPRINHYYEDHTLRETITGEYTEYGVKFTTGSFSPFVVDCSEQSTGGGYYYGGASTPTISAVKTADAAKSATDYTSGIYGLTFRSTAAFSTFKGVQVDGKTIAAANYIAEDNGGIEVYLKAVYLRTLKDGRHTVTILSDAGNVTMNFTIGGVDSPTTFDAGIALYVGMALTSATGLAWVGRKRS